MSGAAAIAALLMALAGAGPAAASWSAPRSIQVSRYAAQAVAVDARGNAVVAWASKGSPARSPVYRTEVHVTVATAGGRTSSRRVWSGRRAGIAGISVAVDHRGEITVAFVSVSREGTGTVRAAYGRPNGRWRSPRVVGAGSAEPRLAVAPDGEVLLVWAVPGERAGGSHRVAVAWRSPGHAFGTPRTLSRPRPVGTAGAVPLFDAAGTAYLSGPCDGVVRTARRESGRFGAPIAVARGSVLGFSLSVADAGRGVASWAAGRCTSDAAAGPTPGQPFASVLAAGTFRAATPLSSSAGAFATNALAVPADGRGASWGDIGPERSGVFFVEVGSGGAIGPVEPVGDGLIPFLADGGGDVVLARVFPGPPSSFGAGGAAVRPAGGGAAERSPAPFGGQIAVASPVGRRVAVLWNANVAGAGSAMALSVWRP